MLRSLLLLSLSASAARAWLPAGPAGLMEAARRAAREDRSELPAAAVRTDQEGGQALAGLARRMAEYGAAGRPFTVIFDLDDTVVDPGRRLLLRFEEFTAKIERRLSPEELARVRSFGERAAKDTSLLDYNIADTLERLEVGDRAVRLQARNYSALRFGADMELDEAVPGARAMLERVAAADGTIAYVSDRSASMREATLESLRRLRLPLPDSDRVRLYLSRGLLDRDHKKRAYAAVRADLPPVLAGFENHSGHAAVFGEAFPEAMNFFLTTRDPGDGDVPEGAARIEDYLAD